MATTNCVICLEELKSSTINSNYLSYIFRKTCNCTVPVHETCLLSWYTHHKKCPYCKSVVHNRYLYDVVPKHVICLITIALHCIVLYTIAETFVIIWGSL